MASQKQHMPVSLTLEHVSPVTRLLEKRKLMLHVQESLDAQKEEYQRKEELFKRREENLRKKDLELQEALVSFNKFLKENEHKRRRADHRANEEVRKRKKWEADIVVKKKQLTQLEADLAKLRLKVKKNEKHSAYLEAVKQNKGNNQFVDVDSVIARHRTLEEAHSDLLAKQAACTDRHEQFRQKIVQFKKEKYNNALVLNNRSAVMNKHLEEHVKLTNEYQDRLIQSEAIDADRRAKTTQMIHSVENLYMRCRKVGSKIKHTLSKLSPKDKETMTPYEIRLYDTIAKLEVVNNYLKDFDAIVTKISGQSTSQGRGKSAYNLTYEALKAKYGQQNADPNRLRQRKQEQRRDYKRKVANAGRNRGNNNSQLDSTTTKKYISPSMSVTTGSAAYSSGISQ